jgi:hypothetical protein
MRTLSLLLVAVLATSASGCDDDSNSITGTYNLFIGETLDTCDGILNNDITSQIVIGRSGDEFTVAFGDDGVLTGQLDNQGLIQAEGPLTVTIVVDGQPNEVDSFMEIQISVRRENVQVTGRLTYDGTHPNSPGVQCVQEFGATGQRLSLSPLI